MIALLLVVFVFTYSFYHFYWKRKDLPPGPTPLPFLGNMLGFYFNDIDVQMDKWRRRFGDLLVIWYGDIPVISLHSAPTILETFLKDGETFAGRPYFKWDDVIRDGRNGIIFTEGSQWRVNRRFALTVFRNFGLGRNMMQERVLVEVTNLISDVKENLASGAKEVSIQNAIDIAVGSIINNLTLGYRYGKEKAAEFERVKKFATYLVSQAGNPLYRIMDYNPQFYKHFPIFGSYYKSFTAEVLPMKEFFYEQIENHRKAIDFEANEDPNDYVEAFLRHQYQLKKEDSPDIVHFGNDQLYASLLDLWVAGQETTSNTLAWLCVYLIQNQDIQKKLHSELSTVIGSDRLVTLDDKSSLHYVNAVVAETQRYCNLVPVNVFHRTTKATKIHGYDIPANTIITHQVSTVLKDERYFPDPHTFKPERFLDENGRFFQPPELMPFGVGKRACLGEGLARLELFLFTANMFNHFKFDYPSDVKDFGKRICGGTTVPAPFLCKIQNRF